LDEVQLQQDLDSVKEFYQNHGYIDVEVKDVRKERPSGPIVITISIVEDRFTTRGRLPFAGYTITTEQKLRTVTR